MVSGCSWDLESDWGCSQMEIGNFLRQMWKNIFSQHQAISQSYIGQVDVLYYKGKMDRADSIYRTPGQSHQESNQAMLHKGNTGTSKALQTESTVI
ncbi:hypothetical protein STEG23_028788 [Scotinomys teguina]